MKTSKNFILATLFLAMAGAMITFIGIVIEAAMPTIAPYTGANLVEYVFLAMSGAISTSATVQLTGIAIICIASIVATYGLLHFTIKMPSEGREIVM